MKLKELQENLHDKTLFFRSLERLSKTLKFERAFNKASEEDQKDIIKCIDSFDKKGILCKLKTLLRESIDTYNITDIRLIASTIGIRHYSSMTKAQLLSLIHQSGVI